MTRRVLAAALAATVAVAWACGGGDGEPAPDVGDVGDVGGGGDTGGGDGSGTRDAGEPDAGEPDAGTPDSGTDIDAGTPDGGDADAGTDAGVDGGVTPTAGPWPTDAVVNYSSRYGIGWVQSVGVDDAYNIWLLDGDRIGVLQPGKSKPVWVSGIGQASQGFGRDKLATGSTVICGGAAGQAYVGYSTYDLLQPKRELVEDPEYLKGDLDVVQLGTDGKITLVEHLNRSSGTSQPWPKLNLGIRNSNDWHYDEDRTVLTCQKVMKGRDKGEVYIGTNHGVTRIRGLEYNSHRHPVWTPPDDPNNLRIGYSYGLGIAQNGDVLIANEWKIAILPPPAVFGDWEFHAQAPWALDTYNQELNTLAEMDYWRAFQQTVDGQYYVGSRDFGLWQLVRTQWAGSANWFKVTGLPTEKINALQATDDGSLFIGTDDQGLWRMDAKKNLSRFSDVPGDHVRQLVYDPTVTPAMLYVITENALYVVRGH